MSAVYIQKVVVDPTKLVSWLVEGGYRRVDAIESPGEVAAKIEAVRKSGRKSVLLLVERGGELRFVALRLG